MAIMAAITITVAQTKEAYEKATVKEVKKDIKASDKKNAISITN
jgi:hypothetical protein